MAELSISAASAAYVEGPVSADQVAGEAFNAGAEVYLKITDGRWYKAQTDGTAAEAGADGIGMALFTAAAAGQRGTIARPGATVSVGTGTAGIIYVLGDTAGSLMPSADAGSTDKVTIAALGIGSSRLLLCHVYNAGAVLA